MVQSMYIFFFVDLHENVNVSYWFGETDRQSSSGRIMVWCDGQQNVQRVLTCFNVF